MRLQDILGIQRYDKNKYADTARFKHYSKGRLYYLKVVINDTTYFKLGYSGKGVEARVKSMLNHKIQMSIEVLECFEFTEARYAFTYEQLLHSIVKDLGYGTGEGLDILSNGNSELYLKDIREDLFEYICGKNKSYSFLSK